MNIKLAKEILQLLESFSEPITKLSDALEMVECQEERKKFRRALGEAMGKLDGEIGYPIRIKFGIKDRE